MINIYSLSILTAILAESDEKQETIDFLIVII